ncbi:MAG: hypothetical protein WBQ24_10820 [Xanthobacteraceae bacterium]
MVARTVVASAALLSATLSMLGGCVSQVQLANNKGQTAQCNAAGVSLASSVVAAVQQKGCIDRYKGEGYHQVALPAEPVSPFTIAPAKITGKPQANQCNTYGAGLAGVFIGARMQLACTSGATTPASTAKASQSQSSQK